MKLSLVCLGTSLFLFQWLSAQIKYQPVLPYPSKPMAIPLVNELTKPDLDLRPLITKYNLEIRNQGNRGTCSIHALTFLIEFANKSYLGSTENDLSEEYLNYVSNLATNSKDDGGFYADIDKGFQSYGMISESISHGVHCKSRFID